MKHHDRLGSPLGKRLTKLAKKIGLEWWVGQWPTWHADKGHAVHTAQLLSHEIGHFLVAAKARRSKPNYGLADPLGRGKMLVSAKTADREEIRACLVAHAVLLENGATEAQVVDEIVEQNITLVHVNAYGPALVRRGIIRPTTFRELARVIESAN